MRVAFNFILRLKITIRLSDPITAKLKADSNHYVQWKCSTSIITFAESKFTEHVIVMLILLIILVAVSDIPYS